MGRGKGSCRPARKKHDDPSTNNVASKSVTERNELQEFPMAEKKEVKQIDALGRTCKRYASFEPVHRSDYARRANLSCYTLTWISFDRFWQWPRFQIHIDF